MLLWSLLMYLFLVLATNGETGSSSQPLLPSMHALASPVSIDDYKKLDEFLLFDGRFRSMLRRRILMPNNETVVDFDVLKQKSESVIVFVWDTRTRTTTLIQEYHPGIERLMIGTVAGMYERDKHSSALEAAQFELEEEAQLLSRQWIPLLHIDQTVIPFDKYSDNRFYAYLALDPELVETARMPDVEEHIVVFRDVGHRQLMELVSSGRINVLSSLTILLGLKKLKELGFEIE
jgi:hypothetical protein